MSRPSKPAFRYFKINLYASSFLIQIFKRNFIRPADITDLSLEAVVKGIEFVYVYFDNSLAIGAVQLQIYHFCL